MDDRGGRYLDYISYRNRIYRGRDLCRDIVRDILTERLKYDGD